MDYTNLKKVAYQGLKKMDINFIKKVNKTITLILVIFSSFFLFDSLYNIFLTSGVVYGSEFGMQIKIANLLAKLLLFLSTYFLWIYTDKIIKRDKLL